MHTYIKSSWSNVKMGHAILTLLCLWSCIMTATSLTDIQVHTATKYIKDKYNSAEEKQYAYAAVFSEQECQSLSSNNNLQILKNEKDKEIKDALNNDNLIYKGSQMVLATYKKEKKGNIHSEYRLLFPSLGSDVSPVQQLVNTNPGAACAIFYTLNSPCVGICANTKDSRNIIENLKVFNKYNNNKAFVYNKLYHWDDKKGKEGIWDGLTEINNKMDVYRCSDGICLRCFENVQNHLKNKDACLN